MEQFEVSINIHQMMSKFSTAQLILRYFGSLSHAHWVMTLASKLTSNCWRKNKQAFLNAFNTRLPILKFHKEFDERTVQILTSYPDSNIDEEINGILEKEFQLAVTLKSHESFSLFIDYLSNRAEYIKENQSELKIRLNEIMIETPSETVGEDYSELLETLQSLGISFDCVKMRHQFNISSGSLPSFCEKYVSEFNINRSTNLNDSRLYQYLAIKNFDHVRCISFSYERWFHESYKITKIINNIIKLEYLHVTEFPHDYSCTQGEMCISRVIKEIEGVTKVALETEIFNHMNIRLALIKTEHGEVASVQLGKDNPCATTIIKHNCCLLYSFCGKDCLLQADTVKITFKDKRCLLYSDEKFLAFRKLGSLYLQNAREVTEDSDIFKWYKNEGEKIRSKVSIKDFFLIQNNNFESMRIVHMDRPYIPNPACRLIEFRIAYNFTKRECKNLQEYFSKIPKSTRVKLCFSFLVLINPWALITMKAALTNLNVSEFVLECCGPSNSITIRHLGNQRDKLVYISENLEKISQDFGILPQILCESDSISIS